MILLLGGVFEPSNAKPTPSGYLTVLQMNPALAQEMFEEAQAAWLEVYADGLVDSFIQLVNNPSGYSVEEREALRRARVLAQRLRSLYHFLDKRPEVPEDFAEFVKRFGKLKDSLVAGKK